MQIQEYESLIQELTEIESDWESNFTPRSAGGASASASAASMPSIPFSSPSPSSALAAPSGGLLYFLKRLPIIGNILRMLGL